MKTRCPFSGVTSIIADAFPDVFTIAPHPVMYLSQTKLFALAERVITQRFSEDDAKALFVALIRSTGLAKFHREAAPSYTTAMKHLHDVLYIANIVPRVDASKLPNFVIDEASADLESIGQWRKDIDEVIRVGADRAAIDYVNKSNEALLERMHNAAYSTPREKAILIAKYLSRIIAADSTLNVGTIPNPIRHSAQTTIALYWADIIKADGLTILSVPDADIAELEDHVIDKLPLGTPQSKLILDHIRALKSNKSLVDEFADVILRPPVGRSTADNIMAITLLDDEDLIGNNGVEPAQHSGAQRPDNSALHAAIADAPTTEPRRVDYATMAEYLRAKAAFHLAAGANKGIGGMQQ